MSEPAARRRHVAAAGHGGDPAIARAALSDHDPTVRATALGALARAGDLRDRELAAALTDTHHAVRRRAATVAARHPQVDLASALGDEEPFVVEAAAWACGERERPGSPAVARLAAIATGHDDPLCREAAVAALGAIGDDRGLDAILTACTDKPPVRRRAVLALAPFTGPRVDAALAEARQDRDWQVRQAAEDLLEA